MFEEPYYSGPRQDPGRKLWHSQEALEPVHARLRLLQDAFAKDLEQILISAIYLVQLALGKSRVGTLQL